MLTQLSGEGLNILGFGQGFSAMCEPCRKTEVLIESGKLAHRGNPVLEWMANNVAIAEDANGNIRCSRNRSTEKIDGIVALVMAVGVHSTAVRTADPDWNIYVL
jgi:phage terminase large subunit-like protein